MQRLAQKSIVQFQAAMAFLRPHFLRYAILIQANTASHTKFAIH
jgi:hypothetical protein